MNDLRRLLSEIRGLVEVKKSGVSFVDAPGTDPLSGDVSEPAPKGPEKLRLKPTRKDEPERAAGKSAGSDDPMEIAKNMIPADRSVAWDGVLAGVQDVLVRELKPHEAANLFRDLKKAGYAVSKKGGDTHVQAPAAEVEKTPALAPEKPAAGTATKPTVKQDPKVATATKTVDDFEAAMQDILKDLKTDSTQKAFDRDRQMKLKKLVGTLKDVVGGASSALTKAIGR